MQDYWVYNILFGFARLLDFDKLTLAHAVVWWFAYISNYQCKSRISTLPLADSSGGYGDTVRSPYAPFGVLRPIEGRAVGCRGSELDL